MPRCCAPIPNEFAPTYASVLVGNVESQVKAIEKTPMQSCLTAWCQHCSRAYLLTNAMHLFPHPSAHHAHMVVFAQKLKENE